MTIKITCKNYTIITYRYFNIQKWDKYHSTQHLMEIAIISKLLYKYYEKLPESSINVQVIFHHSQIVVVDKLILQYLKTRHCKCT